MKKEKIVSSMAIGKLLREEFDKYEIAYDPHKKGEAGKRYGDVFQVVRENASVETTDTGHYMYNESEAKKLIRREVKKIAKRLYKKQSE